MPSTLQPVISTHNPERSVAFYAALFSATLTQRVPDTGRLLYQGLRIGNADLGIVVAATTVDGPQRIMISVDVDTLDIGPIDELLVHVPAAGGRVLGPPSDMPWGQRVAHLQDPDGNAVNLTQAIH